MSSVSNDQIAQAKQLDLLSYLQRYEPDELVPNGGSEYTTKTHGSLIISNGKWIWNKRGIGGRSTLDYLIKVRDMGFVEAVSHLSSLVPTSILPAGAVSGSSQEPTPGTLPFHLPPRHVRATRVEAYLAWRGIDAKIIRECITNGTLYEYRKVHSGKNYYNCVFVGYDNENAPRYAMLRGAFSAFRGEVAGSDKIHSFRYRPKDSSEQPGMVVACESAIDALSLASVHKLEGAAAWQAADYLSLGGTAPAAVLQYLADNPQTGHVCLALDNDEAGRAAADSMRRELETMGIVVSDMVPPAGFKDWNAALMAERQPKEKPSAKAKGESR